MALGSRISHLARPIAFLCYTKFVREAASRLLRSIPKIVDVFVSLALCILFFAWIGLVLFAFSPEGTKYFSSWSNAITSLYILFTTANCPDVFLLAYEKHRMYFFFFGAYIVIMVYLLSNVLLASVYDAYKEQLITMLKAHYENQAAAIKHAFALLADDRGLIEMDCWANFFPILCDSSILASRSEQSGDEEYNRRRAYKVFQILDKDASRGLDIGEFKLLIEIMNDEDAYIPRLSPPSLNSHMIKALKNLFQEGIDLPWGYHISTDACLDSVVCIDVLLVFCQTVLFVNGSGALNSEALDPSHPWYWALFMFSSFYVLTISTQIGVFGLERFWNISPVQNRYDFFTVYGIFVAELFCILMPHPSGAFLRFVVILHITRSLRVIKYIPALRNLASFVVRLAPTYYRMAMLLLIVFYIYATVGQQAFGGLIYNSNPALNGTDYQSVKYWNVNFNDFPSSMVTLFVLMVINNWFIITDAFMRVTGTKWAAAFFVSFFMIVNLIVLNILMALILECSSVVSKDIEREASSPKSSASTKYDYLAVLRQVLLADEQEDPETLSSSSAVIQSTLQSGNYGSMQTDPRRPQHRASV